MHYLISKALRYGPCVTKGSHTVLPATHTRTIPAFTRSPAARGGYLRLEGNLVIKWPWNLIVVLLSTSLPPLNLHICMILSLFNLVTALVSLMLSLLLVHIYIPLWKSTTALSAMPHLVSGMELPKELGQPVDDESLSLSSDLTYISSSSSSSSLSPPFSLCITPFLFHSRLKTYLSINLSHHSLPHLFGLISRMLWSFRDLISSSVFCFLSFQLFCFIRVVGVWSLWFRVRLFYIETPWYRLRK